MGTEVQIKSNVTGCHSMRDLNEDSNGCSWPIFYGDKALQNGHYQNSMLRRAAADAYLGHDKDIVKQTMLEHEAIFRSQVCELHRLYGIQRVLMDEFKRKELQGNHVPSETGSLISQNTCEGARGWQITGGPLTSPSHVRPSTSEVMLSPVSSVKGKAVFASQNGGSLNTSGLRPSKVRRKMFDLHLPAEEYIDTDDQDPPNGDNPHVIFDDFQDQDRKAEAENGVDLFFGKTETGLKGRRVADLNKPFPAEDMNTFPSGESAESNPCFLGLPHESSLNSHCGSNSETANSFPLGRDIKARGWLSHVLEPEDTKGKKSASQGLWLNHYMPQRQIQGLVNKVNDTSPCLQADKKVVLSRDGAFYSFGSSESLKSPESVLVSQFPSQFPVTLSADSSRSSRPMSVSFWEKPGSSLNKKAMPVQIHQVETSQGAAQSYGIVSEKLQDRNTVSSKSGVGELPSKQNGLYGRSSSGSKELLGSSHLPPLSYDYYKCHDGEVNLNVVPKIAPSRDPALSQGFGIVNGESKQEDDDLATLARLRAKAYAKSDVVVIDHVNSRETKLFDSSYGFASKNEVGKSGSFSSEVDIKRLEVDKCPGDRKLFGHPVIHMSKNESSSLNSLPHQSGVEFVETDRKVKLLDINLPCDLNPESSREENSTGTLVTEKKVSDTKSTSLRHQIIDLNSCPSDDETSPLDPSIPSTNGKLKPIIDLEIPAVLEDEENVFGGQALEQPRETSVQCCEQKPEQLMDEFSKVAAEAIIAMSSGCLEDYFVDVGLEESNEDRLNWFVNTVLSCSAPNEGRVRACPLRGKNGGGNDYDSTSEEVDFFELMTLKLMEIKPEDYLPKPFVLESSDGVDESAAATSAHNRPRRGQARRGRQRRDFQRDILPGLASLSRLEVTEDLQTFGGLMRATGHHSWQSSLTRRNSSRNGPARGRRRSSVPVSVSPSSGLGSPGPIPTPLIQQLDNIEKAGFEERKSLTGWGKTTRRPRRQRCPAGNPPIIHLT